MSTCISIKVSTKFYDAAKNNNIRREDIEEIIKYVAKSHMKGSLYYSTHGVNFMTLSWKNKFNICYIFVEAPVPGYASSFVNEIFLLDIQEDSDPPKPPSKKESNLLEVLAKKALEALISEVIKNGIKAIIDAISSFSSSAAKLLATSRNETYLLAAGAINIRTLNSSTENPYDRYVTPGEGRPLNFSQDNNLVTYSHISEYAPHSLYIQTIGSALNDGTGFSSIVCNNLESPKGPAYIFLSGAIGDATCVGNKACGFKKAEADCANEHSSTTFGSLSRPDYLGRKNILCSDLDEACTGGTVVNSAYQLLRRPTPLGRDLSSADCLFPSASSDLNRSLGAGLTSIVSGTQVMAEGWAPACGTPAVCSAPQKEVCQQESFCQRMKYQGRVSLDLNADGYCTAEIALSGGNTSPSEKGGL